MSYRWLFRLGARSRGGARCMPWVVGGLSTPVGPPGRPSAGSRENLGAYDRAKLLDGCPLPANDFRFRIELQQPTPEICLRHQSRPLAIACGASQEKRRVRAFGGVKVFRQLCQCRVAPSIAHVT